DKRIELRIGINLGDVVIDGDDIQGDGVNVAARLESMAEPGGICVSGMVYEGVRDRIDVPFEDLGEQAVKNIVRPVHVWRWLAVDGAASAGPSEATEPYALPDKPSIAVLPFDNMSGDAEQEYFSDGITEDLITELSRFRSLSVIARNSTFSYKGKSRDVRMVATELRARYVVEGSVRRFGDKVRITVQLIDAKKGDHLWAERYDRELSDIFAVQDEIATTISATIVPEIDHAEQVIARRRPPESLSAWECYQRGIWHIHQFTLEAFVAARPLFEKAVRLDPEFAAAHSGLAYALFQEWMYSHPNVRGDQLDRGYDAARRSVAIDDHDANAHFVLGRILGKRGEYHKARAECQKAIDLNPSLPHAYFGLGDALLYLRQFGEALEMLQVAARLSPRDPHHWAFVHHQAVALLGLKRYEEAVDMERRALLSSNASFHPYATMISALGHLGRKKEAQEPIEQLRHLQPGYSCERHKRQFPIFDEFAEHYVDGMRKAGLPEN
ncbi:MAG: adenylate/guanylate cyclase domain-containing protein, partial [Nitrospira sp.]|nr:adenylate/guanylate cyclase domain-containing protein [Nitrospira sp.]